MATWQKDGSRVSRWALAACVAVLVASCTLGSVLVLGVLQSQRLSSVLVGTTASPQSESAPSSVFNLQQHPLDANGDAVFTPLDLRLPTSDHTALPTALAAAPVAGPVVTPATAESILAAAWELRADALSRHDPTLLGKFETALALEADVGSLCGCSGSRSLGPMGQVGFYIPRQTTYPATFMADVATTNAGKPFQAFLAFRRESATTPWLLAFAGGLPVSAAQGTFPATDSDGYLLPQTSAPLFDPATAHGLLASYWRDAKRTGAIPSSDIFAPGVWTTEWANVLRQHGQGRVAANGLVGYYAYKADPVHDPLFTYPEGQGWQIVCSALRVETTFTGAGPGDGPVQDKAHKNWGRPRHAWPDHAPSIRAARS